MNAHRYSEAETSLEKAVRLNPKSVKANYQLGLLLARMGKKRKRTSSSKSRSRFALKMRQRLVCNFDC